MTKLLPLFLAALALTGCDLTMTRQPKYGPQAAAALFPDGTSAQAPPEGTIAQDAPAEAAAAEKPPRVTLALLQRGAERHAIFCQPCHGASGAGDGVVVQRGFPRPQPYDAAQVRAAPAAELYGAIANGYGTMYPFRDRVPPADRWALVAYIRALQVARSQGAPDVPPPPGSRGGPA